MTSQEPEEPTFASPTPPGSLPAPDLGALRLPEAGDGDTPEAMPADVPTPESVEMRRRTRRRAWTAVGAVVAVAVVATAVVLGVRDARQSAWEPLSTELAEPREAHAVQLVLGSCVEALPDDGPVGLVQAVSCAEPHEAEVVGRTDAPADAIWPGDETLASRGSRSCGADMLGAAAREAADGLRFVVWTPSEESWAVGDRTTLCLAAGSEPTTGSLLE
jgi:hypothetical protein